MIDWLAQPIDPTRSHDLSGAIAWHGRLMMLAWGILAPLAVLAARYFKVLPWQDWPRHLDNPVWWHTHRIGHLAVVIVSLGAFALVLWAGSRSAGPHGLLGYGVLMAMLVQVLVAVLRGTKGGPTSPGPDGSLRGDHYDMTRRRLLFETVHKTLGHALLVAAALCILLGLWTANAPRWMWAVTALWWAALILAAIVFHRTLGAIDTYQAIWGPDPTHPGNRMKRQGWATTRPQRDGPLWKRAKHPAQNTAGPLPPVERTE